MDVMIRVTIYCVAILAALAIPLAVSKKLSRTILAICAGVAAVGGFLIYGYSYAVLEESVALATVKTLIAVCRSFGGGDNLGDIIGAPIFEHTAFHVVFWTIHLLGIFSLASVAITAFGSTLLQNLRLRFNRKREMNIFYHLDQNTLNLARDIIASKKGCAVFVDENPDNDLSLAAMRAGAAVKGDADALNPTVRFLKSIGANAKNRKISVFALDADVAKDQAFAHNFIHSCEALQISPDQTSLTIFGNEDDTDNALLASKASYGFGNVVCVNKPYLTARLLLQIAPTYKTLTFDSEGRAKDDFFGVLIGCDRVGQAVLRQIVMNTQFAGNHFHLAVFAPDIQEMIGRLSIENAQMLEEYDIQFYAHDGRSLKLYQYLSDNLDRLSYIVLCTGNKARNMEIAQQIYPFLERKGHSLPVYQCDHDGVRYLCGTDAVVEQTIYSANVLCSNELDRMAIALNHMYCGGGDEQENWRNCDYFSRMSSRASADFMPAMLYASGATAENWNPSGQLLDNLAITEHKRWNAFHFAMGFATMDEHTWNSRAEAYLREISERGSSKIKIGKDLKRRLHACLVPWDELDALSARESSVTGKTVDYKQMDRNNILAISQFYKDNAT